MVKFIVHLHCTACNRHEEIVSPPYPRVTNFNADKECCGQWMEHLNKRIECPAKGLVCTDCVLYPC